MGESKLNQLFAEKLFLHVLNDLLERKDSNYLYDRVNCARLLRQLLIDGDVLCQIANKRVRTQLLFTVIKYGEKPDNLRELNEFQQKYVINNPGVGAYLHPLKLSKYLDHVVAVYVDQQLQVRDIIKYVANNYGGVHLDPGDEDKQVLHVIDQNIVANNEGAIFGLLSSIINNSLSGLLPLKDILIEQLASEGESESFDEEIKVVEPLESPGSTDEKIGTISLWLRAKQDSEWYKKAKEVKFPPFSNGKWTIVVTKLEGQKLMISLEGLLDINFNFEVQIPDFERIDPQHGIHVLFSWKYPELTLYVHGKIVEKVNLE
jgi:hypothetical protein